MDATISIIIPVYNISSFLDKCIESVCKQTYKNLEIILVDDGSTDNSGIICDKWAATDDRIITYHKENGGLSDARNYGLSKATGSYILYLDGDDWLDIIAAEALYKNAVQHNADIVQGGYYYAYEEYLLVYNEPASTIEYDKEGALRELISNGRIKNFAWGCLIKRELAIQVPFIKGKYFEDSFWKYQIIELSKRFIYVSTPTVYYRQRSQSISSGISLKNLDLLEGIEERLKFIQKKYPQLFDLALKGFYSMGFLFMSITKNSDENIKRAFKDYYLNINLKYKEYLNKYWYKYIYLRFMSVLFFRFNILYSIIILIKRCLCKFKKVTYLKIYVDSNRTSL